MHGSVCLFSKYLQHLLEGENLDELDISSASSSNNIFRNKKSLSTGWTGTCPILQLINEARNGLDEELTSLNSIIYTYHQNIISSYESLESALNYIFIVYSINSPRPSGLTTSLTPSFENEFRDKTNNTLIGGEIYYDFTNKLKPLVKEINGDILNEINSLIDSNALKNTMDSAYFNFQNFDNTVVTASNIMNRRIIDLKDYFLTLQFWLMFFTWGYFLFFIALAILYIIYLDKQNIILYYIMIILVNILFVFMLVEIFLSSFFGQVRLICHEVPRIMNFIFTGTYMISGNSASYPAQFGRGDENMTKMFTTCLNGDSDLLSLFIPSDYLNSLISLENDVNSLNTDLSNILMKSNIISNDYDSIENSVILKAIIKFELLHDNLFLASEGFGEDEINNILSNIRKKLDSENCNMTHEYYVVRESDCPPGSIKLDVIYNTTGVYHCYIIQKLNTGASASYGSGCDNNYINKAISFIGEINDLLEDRLFLLKSFQKIYSGAYKNLSYELSSLSEILSKNNSVINKYLYSIRNYSNCGSSRFDLIDFSDFIGDTTEYDARLVVIFSAFLGVFGFVLLYSFLVLINGFSAKDNYNDDDYGYDFGNYKNRKINIKVNKSKKNKNNSNYYDKDDDDEEFESDDEDRNKKSKRNTNAQVPPKMGQKVEMSYISKKNEDSDSD
jgi:hypothetical protein